MARKFKAGEEVTIRSGELDVPIDVGDPDGELERIDVGGVRAFVDDGETYTNERTGIEHLVCTAAPEHGGGLTSVPVDRLAAGAPRRSFGWSRDYGDNFDETFKKRTGRKLRPR